MSLNAWLQNEAYKQGFNANFQGKEKNHECHGTVTLVEIATSDIFLLGVLIQSIKVLLFKLNSK